MANKLFKRQNIAGFSLLEVLIVAAIGAILVGILAASLIQFRSIFQTGDVSVGLQQEMRLAMQYMTSELRRTSLAQMAITQNSPDVGTDSILYHLPIDSDADGLPDLVSDVLQWDSVDITISVDSATSSLIKSMGGSNAILGHNVTSVRFINHALDAALNLNELKIILTLQKTGKDGRLFTLASAAIIDMRN